MVCIHNGDVGPCVSLCVCSMYTYDVTDNVVDGLAISLLLTQLNFADNNSWQFVNDQVKSMMDQQHLLEFDKLVQ